MKNTPIVILNRDRLGPTRQLVGVLQSRGYNNILILDNQTTYQPLLDWYKESGVEVFYNDVPETKYDNGSLYTLSMVVKHPRFVDIVKQHYVFTDSDVVPVSEIPDNFIDDMIEVSNHYPTLHKIGLGIKVDDIPPELPQTPRSLDIEVRFWNQALRVPHPTHELYSAPVDTGFALYAPNAPALWSSNSVRMGGNYIARHIPFYYDLTDLPADELFYLTNLPPNRGPVVSMEYKQALRESGRI